MMSDATICSSDAPTMPAALARASVASLRPASEVRTSMPFSTSLLPTPLPIMPGAITATIGCIDCLLCWDYASTPSLRSRPISSAE